MPVFKVSDCDWYYASTAQEARDHYVQFIGNDDMAYDVKDIVALTPEQLRSMQFTGDDGTQRTFEEQLEIMSSWSTEPEFFASTEW